MNRKQAILVIFCAAFIALALFCVVRGHTYPVAWLRWQLGWGQRPVVDTNAAQWAGEWDADPEFWAGWDDGSGDIQALPSEAYERLPIPREAGAFTYVGGSQVWRGLDVVVEAPNTNDAILVAEYWDAQTRSWEAEIMDGTRVSATHYTLSASGYVGIGGSHWGERVLVIQEKAFEGYWVRFSVTADLSEIDAVASIVHNAPVLVSDGWEMKHHLRTACQNRPGLHKIYVTVTDGRGKPIRGIQVGFDTDPSYGVAWDHRNVWGLTNDDGYLEWDHLGKPTMYNLYVNGKQVVANIRTDFGNGYCRPPGSNRWTGWRSINRPGIYSWDIELRQQGEE